MSTSENPTALVALGRALPVYMAPEDPSYTSFARRFWVGMSWWWRGYTHGKHRLDELLVEGNRPAKARGRPKGWKQKPPK